MKTPMICRQCGMQIFDTDRFCFACGAPHYQNPPNSIVYKGTAPLDRDLKKAARKARKSMGSKSTLELDGLIERYEALLQSYDVLQRSKSTRIFQINRYLQSAIAQYESQIKYAEQNLQKASSRATQKISKLGSCGLYHDRLLVENTSLPLNCIYDIRIEVTGTAYESLDVQHSARPTLTRITAGALVAGPIGAVVGGAAQKHSTTVQKKSHDDRKIVLTALSTIGSGSTSFPYAREMRVRSFADEVRRAIANYDRRMQTSSDVINEAEAHLSRVRESTYDIDRAYADLAIEQQYDHNIASMAYQIQNIQAAISALIQRSNSSL